MINFECIIIKKIMSPNLLELLKGYISQDIVSQASNLLGESESGIYKAVAAAIPTVLSGMANKARDLNVMENVMNLITEVGNSQSVTSDSLSLLTNSGLNSDSKGGKLMNLLFGGKATTVTDIIAGAGGIKSSSAAVLLGMTGTIILRHLNKSGVSLIELTDLLTSEKSNIFSEVPRGLNPVFGFSDNYKSQAKNTVKAASKDSFQDGLPKWLLPFLIIGVTLLALYFFTKACNKEVNSDANKDIMMDSLDIAMDSLGDYVEDPTIEVEKALGDFLKFKLPNGIELNAPEFGIENQLVKWMNDKTKKVDKTTWFNFDRLLFETGKSTLRPESQDQLENIAVIMDAYPSMNIKLGGYTDNVGDPAANLKLSDERAKSVMAGLIVLGVEPARLAAEGYGEQYPLAPNETEQGRAQNRRIAIRVTNK